MTRRFVGYYTRGTGQVTHATVVELVDALDLGSSTIGVRVRVPPVAPYSEGTSEN